MTFGYTGDGLRAWKQSSAGVTYFVFDGEQLVCEMDTSGNVTAYNIWGANGLIGRKTSSTTTYYLYDPQGTVAQTFDASSAIQTTRMYDAWGNLMLGTQPSTDPYGYNGQWGYYRDAETSLLLLTHRYYDATRGRFLTRDPIGYRGGANLYGYVGNNPTNLVDPLGKEPVTLTLIALASLGYKVVTTGWAIGSGLVACYQLRNCMSCLKEAKKTIDSARSIIKDDDVFLKWLRASKPGEECWSLCLDAGKKGVQAFAALFMRYLAPRIFKPAQ